MAAQQPREWTSPASLQELTDLAGRLSQSSETLLAEDLRRLAALADLQPSQDEDEERQRLGAITCLEDLMAGRSLATFDAQFTTALPWCAGGLRQRPVAELRPDKHVIFTEGCQELGGRPLSLLLDDWKSGERYSMNVIADLNAGCEGWIDWNLCVDEVGGPNHRGNFCLAPIVCDTETDQVLLQPAYWHLGHFSRYVQPGAKRVACSSSRDALEVTAFKNPSGSIVVVVLNQSEQDLDFWLKLSGMGAARTDAPRRSITTYVVER